MAKASKLYAKLLQKPQPSIKFRDFEKLLSAFGFALDRTVGSHTQNTSTPKPIGRCPSSLRARRRSATKSGSFLI